MKHRIVLTFIVALGLAAIAISEKRKVEVPPGPAAMLFLVGDTEQELMRMPVHFTRMSDAEEIELGKQIASAYSPEREEHKKPAVQEVDRYLTRVGSRMAGLAHRKLPYQFHYIPDSSFVNAFALPGGHVYVGQGLLALMDSEDELASVLGHEIEHIDHYHCVERLQLEQAMRKIPFGGLAALPIEVFQAGYSKDQELEADREGTEMAVQAGYSANGAIRMFETFERLYQASRKKARNPADELTDVASQTLEGYFRSHPLASERIAQIQKLIASKSWPVVAERNLEVAYIFWTARAENLFNEHKYVEAQLTALQSLKLKSDQEDALDILARAYFSQANFEDAAATYLKLLRMGANLDFARLYAVALAAADPKNAAAEFDKWFRSAPPSADDLKVTRAGLALLAGNSSPADSLREVMLHAEADRTPPDRLGELGWWCYLGGDYPHALKLLEEAVQQRPGATQWLTDRAWVQIQSKRLEDSFQSLNEVYSTTNPAPDQKMARAVTFWLSGQKQPALQDFEIAVSEQPEWKNPKWVRALYSPQVADAVQQIQSEQERLRKLQEARLRKR
jgi:predicted Zn-dependent protease